MNKPYILIAEDDADDRFLLRTAFQENGFNDSLEFVENGVELMDRLHHLLIAPGEQLPVLIMLDLNMPKKDGREALKEIKATNELRKIPIVIFSTTNNTQEVARCYDLGANSYITKPNSFEQLISTISYLRNYWVTINNNV